MQYSWTPRRAAWFRFRLGRGASLESVLRDRRIGAQSAQQLKGCATRWKLPLGDDNKSLPTLAIPLPAGDWEILEAAAQERGLSAASFAADVLHIACSIDKKSQQRRTRLGP